MRKVVEECFRVAERPLANESDGWLNYEGNHLLYWVQEKEGGGGMMERAVGNETDL